jgi:hypothetical protein
MRYSLSFLVLFVASTSISAQKTDGEKVDKEAKAPETISLSDGKLQMTAPVDWQKQAPRSRILAYEFSIPSGEDGVNDGRFTVSTMGGSIKANIDRWVKQFPETTKSKIEDRKVGEQTVHMVDLTGTFLDSRGPAFPAEKRENYRLLAAIIPTKETGHHFLKFYGPAGVVENHAKAFTKMVESMRKTEAAAEESE